VILRFAPADEALSVRGNEDGIRQILLNLICNAIRHTPAGGHVDVTVRRAKKQGTAVAAVEVRDTGCGIPQDAMEHLFEAGFSGTGETPGLGLAVCRQLMAQHGGTIRLSSLVGQGTEFQLEFPAL
jgi:signal transduction histidine kinase